MLCVMGLLHSCISALTVEYPESMFTVISKLDLSDENVNSISSDFSHVKLMQFSRLKWHAVLVDRRVIMDHRNNDTFLNPNGNAFLD